MARFKDWADLDGGATLDLPIGGRTYRIPSPPGRVGLRVQAFMETVVDAARAQEAGKAVELDAEALDDAAELDLYRDVLGPACDAMVADGVPWEAMKRAALAAMFWVAFDAETAAAVWEGKAPTAAVRRGRSAAASMTRRPASTSGTSPRPARRRSGSGKARRSPGRNS